MAMIIGTETWVTDIPTNVSFLNITLQSDADFDLQLYTVWKTEKTDDSQCIVGYDCVQDTNTPKIWAEYNGMTILFSGDDRVAPVMENILIVRTEIKMSLWVRSYGTGEGIVVYEWQGIEPCNFERFGCAPCDEYAGCKDNKVPVCDGSAMILCVEEDEQDEKQKECDEYMEAEEAQVCQNDFSLPDCLSWIPTAAPSYSPSVIPTFAPSGTPSPLPDCWHFKLGECDCPPPQPLDLLFILDSSDSIPEDEWTLFVETLAEFFENDLQDNAHIGLMQFSSRTEIAIPMTTQWNPTQWGQITRDLKRTGGATWTRRAINAAWYDMWKPYIDSGVNMAERVPITILITDGEPSYMNLLASQSPCDEDTGEPVAVIDNYINAGINIRSVVIGDWEEGTAEVALGCLQDTTIAVFQDLTQPRLVINDTLAEYILPCNEQSFSEYNGRYSVVLENGVPVPDQDGKYTYLGSKNWIVYWTPEGFVFSDPFNKVLQDLGEVDATETERLNYKYPRNGSDFQYNGLDEFGNPDPQLRPQQVICCDGIPAPSRAPSTRPSQAPIIGTRSPTTSQPSTSPTTDEPSTTPTTDCPTVMPSYKPSTDPITSIPTLEPTTDEPTEMPSDGPTTSTPTTDPTVSHPTKGPIIGTYPPSVSLPTNAPSHSPSVDPSLSPTEAPIHAPTVSSPSVGPTMAPSTDIPSCAPDTTMPTPSPTSGPTTEPSTKPSTAPTTAPTTQPSVSPSVDPTAAPTKWDCVKQSSLAVEFSVCADPATSGTESGNTVATFVDIHGNEATFTLIPDGEYATSGPAGFYTPGSSYSWLLPTDAFEQQVIDFTLDLQQGATQGDGLCLSEVTVTSEYMNDPTDTIHVNDVVTSENGMWLDSPTQCRPNDNACPCGQFDSGGLQFVCQATQNSRSVNMIIGTESWITWIPRYVHGLNISLTATSDLDLKLYNCTGDDDFSCEASDVCLAGYKCENPHEGTFQYGGMDIYFSGDYREAPVTESIYIPSVTEPLGLYVRSYQSGTGVVAYSWDSVDPCPESLIIGCNPCEEWGACKDGDIPVCFGGENPICVPAGEAEERQDQCDDWKTEQLEAGFVSCGPVELNLRDCIAPPTTAPTRTPSSTPTISTPSKSPSMSPTISAPSVAPDTSAPSVVPTKLPTVTLPCVKQDEVRIVMTLCDSPSTAGSVNFQLTANFVDADGQTGSHDLLLPNGATSVSPGETLRFVLDESDLAVYTNQIIEWTLTTTSTDGIGISFFSFNEQMHWNEDWYSEDVTCVWIDANECAPNDNHCECGTYPDATLFCQEWSATSEVKMILGDQLWVFDAPLGATNVTVNMTANVDFDLKLISGLYADDINPAGVLAENPVPCYIGYSCEFSTPGFHTISNGTDSMEVYFSGDVRAEGGTSIEEEMHIDSIAFPVSIWVRAWNTGEGLVQWTWDGLEGCTWIGGADCLPCKEYDCNNLNPVCFGDYPPICLGNDVWVQEQQSCDDYTSNDVRKQTVGGAVCSTTRVDLPSCITAPPSVLPSALPSFSPSKYPTSDEPSIQPTVSPTMSPTWPCCDGSDIVTGVIGICGTANQCQNLFTNTECEAVGVPAKCTEDYEPTNARECLGACYWGNGQCNEWSTEGSTDMTLEFIFTDIRGNTGTYEVAGPWYAGERREFSYDYIADGVPFQIVDITMQISDSSAFPNDGICVNYLEIELDDLPDNNVLLDEERWFDGNCNPQQKTCPCDGYPVSNVTYRCQEWDGFSTVTMSPGQIAWVTDIPVNMENVVISLDANAAYDLYALEFPEDYESGDGFTYNFNTISDQEFLLACLVGQDCELQVREGMEIIVTPTDETKNEIRFDHTTVNIVIYVIGRDAAGTAEVTYEYVGPDFCKADLRCEPCPSYECKADLDGAVKMSVCDGLGIPFCEREAIAFDLQRQCDDIEADDMCDQEWPFVPDQCRDCYTEAPSRSPLVDPTGSPTPTEPSNSPVIAPSTSPSIKPTQPEQCTCYTPNIVTINMKICDGPSTASSAGSPVVRLCDYENVCNDFTIISAIELGATISESFIIDGITYQQFQDYLVTATILDSSEDGFCVEEWSVNEYPLPNGEELQDDFWVDNGCKGHSNSCDCGYYPEGSIQYSCDAHTGEAEVLLSVTQETWIADIPINVKQLEIRLEANVDLDLQLYVDQSGTAHCIAGYGCEHDLGEPYFLYAGMNISFTGDDRIFPVQETLKIDKSTIPLSLFVKAYGNGGGIVSYSWQGMEPCPQERTGCNECDTYVGCKDDLVPTCDGSANIECVPLAQKESEQGKCDDYDPESFFSAVVRADEKCGEIVVDFPDCNTCSPTVNPTVFPSTTPSRTPSVTPSVEPTDMPSRTPSVMPSVSPSRQPVVPPSKPPSTPPTTSPTTSPTSPPSFSPTSSDSPTTSPTSSPTISPTTSPSSEPTTSPTWCPYICVWDCYSEDVCREACDANVTAAVAAANAECAEQMSGLQTRVSDLEADLASVNATCEECAELNDRVDDLVDILTLEEIEKWQNVVDSGVSCSYVSHTFCRQISGCDLVGDECLDLFSRSPSFSSPSMAPVPCGPDVDSWQAVVDNGTACAFVPLDTCAFISQCQLSISQDVCENRLTGGLNVTTFSNLGLTASITLDFPVIGGNITLLVTQTSISVNDANSNAVLCRSPTSQHDSVVTWTEDCRMQGGESYLVYGWNRYNDEEYLIGPVTITIPNPSIGLEYVQSSNNEVSYLYQVYNHNEDGLAYFQVLDTSCADTRMQNIVGDQIARMTLDCAELAGGYDYTLEAKVDVDGQSENSADTLSSARLLTFTVPYPNLTAAITDVDAPNSFSHSWSVENSAANMGGMMYWANVPDSAGVTYTAADVIRDNDQNGGFDSICWGTASQDAFAQNSPQTCPVQEGQSYHVYYAVDLDGNGLGAILSQVLSFSIASILGTVSVHDPSTDGFYVNYEVFNPFLAAPGQVYLSLFEEETPSATEIIESSNPCKMQIDQASGAQQATMICSGELFGGETYKLWAAIDSDGAGADPQLLVNGPVAFQLSEPTVFVRRYQDVSVTGAQVTYSLQNANPAGLLYYGVQEDGLPDPSLDDVLNGNLLCADEVAQSIGSSSALTLTCNLQPATTYKLWVVTDINGDGEAAHFAHSSNSRDTFQVPSTFMDGVPTVANAGYTGADFTYQLGNSISGETFSYMIRLATEPVPTSPADFEADSSDSGVFRRRLTTGSCTGTLPVEDNEEHTVRIDCQLFAKSNYFLDYLVAGSEIGSVAFESAVPTLTLNEDFGATTESWFLRYTMANPAWGGGLIYWSVAPNSASLPIVPQIIDGTDMICNGQLAQANQDPVEVAITTCTLSGGNTYKLFVAFDIDRFASDFSFSTPSNPTFTIPAPTVPSMTISEVSVDGYTATFPVTNPMQDGFLFMWMLPSSADAPSEGALRTVDSSGDPCGAKVAQTETSITVPCPLTVGVEYTLYYAYDISSRRVSHGAPLTVDVTQRPSLSPSHQPSVPYYDCSPARVATLQGSCFSVSHTCEECCSSSANRELCWPAGSDFENQRDFCCGAEPDGNDQTIIVSDSSGRRSRLI